MNVMEFQYRGKSRGLPQFTTAPSVCNIMRKPLYGSGFLSVGVCFTGILRY